MKNKLTKVVCECGSTRFFKSTDIYLDSYNEFSYSQMQHQCVHCHAILELPPVKLKEN